MLTSPPLVVRPFQRCNPTLGSQFFFSCAQAEWISAPASVEAPCWPWVTGQHRLHVSRFQSAGTSLRFQARMEVGLDRQIYAPPLFSD